MSDNTEVGQAIASVADDKLASAAATRSAAADGQSVYSEHVTAHIRQEIANALHEIAARLGVHRE